MFQMKNRIAVLLLSAVAVMSCTRTGADAFRGYYSFKTGGYVDICGKVYEIERDTVSIDTLVRTISIAGIEIKDTSYRYNTVNDTISSRDTSFVRHLANESGQMRILSDGDSGVKVTYSVTGGAPVVFDARVDGDALTLLPVQRAVNLYVSPGSGSFSSQSMLGFAAVGRRYENTIILDVDVQGEYSSLGLDGVITTSHVNCIAVENE